MPKKPLFILYVAFVHGILSQKQKITDAVDEVPGHLKLLIWRTWPCCILGEFGTRKAVECHKQSLVGHSIGTLKIVIRRQHIWTQGGSAHGASEGSKDVNSNWTRGHACGTLASSCLVLRTWLRLNINNGIISLVEKISRQCHVESVWLLLNTLMQVYDEIRTHGSEINGKKWTLGNLILQPRHVLTESMELLRSLASLRQGLLLYTGTMGRLTSGQYPTQLSFQLIKEKA